jgi:hypothetical protein
MINCKHSWVGSDGGGSKCSKCDRFAGDLFEPNGSVLTLHFENEEQASYFKTWLCNSETLCGDDYVEIDYWQGPHVIFGEPKSF